MALLVHDTRVVLLSCCLVLYTGGLYGMYDPNKADENHHLKYSGKIWYEDRLVDREATLSLSYLSGLPDGTDTMHALEKAHRETLLEFAATRQENREAQQKRREVTPSTRPRSRAVTWASGLGRPISAPIPQRPASVDRGPSIADILADIADIQGSGASSSTEGDAPGISSRHRRTDAVVDLQVPALGAFETDEEAPDQMCPFAQEPPAFVVPGYGPIGVAYDDTHVGLLVGLRRQIEETPDQDVKITLWRNILALSRKVDPNVLIAACTILEEDDLDLTPEEGFASLGIDIDQE